MGNLLYGSAAFFVIILKSKFLKKSFPYQKDFITQLIFTFMIWLLNTKYSAIILSWRFFNDSLLIKEYIKINKMLYIQVWRGRGARFASWARKSHRLHDRDDRLRPRRRRLLRKNHFNKNSFENVSKTCWNWLQVYYH